MYHYPLFRKIFDVSNSKRSTNENDILSYLLFYIPQQVTCVSILKKVIATKISRSGRIARLALKPEVLIMGDSITNTISNMNIRITIPRS